MVAANVESQSQFLTDEALAQFHRDGYYIARGLYSKAEVEKIRDAFMKQNENGPVEGLSEMRHGGRSVYDPNDPLAFYPRMMHPHAHPELPVGPLARQYMIDPRLQPILRDLFGGEEPLAVQSMFYFKPPGARGQDLHQDNYYLRVKPGTCMAAWMAVDDADEENGGMVVVPGTADMQVVCPDKADPEKFFTTEHVEPPAGMHPVPVTLKAGDVLFFNGSLIHGSYPNTSKTRFRRSLICHYVPERSEELSQWYRSPMRFDEVVVPIPQAQGGGPCGTLAEPMGAH
jgi:phytanoyl-CoA hydroxylase